MSLLAPTWKVQIDGDDLVIENAVASWFGGANDPDDDGSTASGISTRANPDFMGCSLPMPSSNGEPVEECAGSPIPALPYLKTFVQVSGPGGSVFLPLIDVGPEIATGHVPDLTKQAFKLVGGNFVRGLVPVKVRILDAAKYLKEAA